MKADDTYNNTDNLINGTGNKTNAVQDKTLNQIMGWLTIVILLGIVLFNSLVICLILSKKKKTRMSFFVGNLAIADLSLGILFVLPESLKFLGVPINIHYCYIFYVFFSMVPYYASTYAIVVLAVDRLYAITRPVSAASKGQMYKLGLCISTWVVGVVLAIQYGVVGVYDYKTNYCSHIFEGFHKSFILYFDLFVMVIIPLAIIIVCYSLIVITIYRREKRGFIQASAKEQADDVQSKSRNISNAKIKTIKLLFVVVSVYLICWLPFFIGALLLHHRMITPKAFIVLYTFAPTNSLANPLVFLLFNFQMFRRKSNGKRKIMYHSSASCATRSLYVSRTQDTDL